MKIVFIEPTSSEANVYSKLRMPILGPVYLGTILKKLGHEVTVYNEDIRKPDYESLDADLIGISILTGTAKRGYDIARRFPKEKVIIGGVHASLLPNEALQYARQVVVGEAEEVIADIAEGRLTDPIVYGKPLQDLDSLPYPDFSIVAGYAELPFATTPVSTSRGCPFDCTFCSVTKVFGRKYRFRGTESVIDELRARDRKSVFFCDDNFAAHPKRTRALLERIKEQGVRGWTCQVRCDVTEDESLLTLLSEAGCATACVGFESVNLKTLEAYQKKQTVADIINAIRSFHKKNIRVHGMFVLGGDDDTAGTVWDTLRFAVKQKIDTIQMMILTPFPGTKVQEDLQAQNRIFSRDWSLYDGQHIVFHPKLISPKQLQLNVMSAYAKFYSFSRFLSLLFKLRLNNALHRLIGRNILRKWIVHNRELAWLHKV